jgi:hypothetical protein
MKEKPGVQTPWNNINQVLAPDERFEVNFPHWQGFLFAPKQPSQLAALLYLLDQEGISICVQGRGTRSLPKEHSVIISARAFSNVVWHEQGIVEVGAGCHLSYLHQFLFERNQEVALEGDPLASSKHSVAGLILSGKTAGIRYQAEAFPEILMGAEMITWEGNQVKWGGPYRSAVAGPALHKLMWGLQSLPGMIIKMWLKTHSIPPARLRLAWSFHQKEALEEQFHALKRASPSWEYLDKVQSGEPHDQGFIFAQISGWKEEMDAFSQVCPGYTKASQQGELGYLKHFLQQQNLKTYSVPKDCSLNLGEYLWLQEWNPSAWLLTPRSNEQRGDHLPIWKQRFWDSFNSKSKTK